ncbi:MAG: hypothetical protein MUF21_13630 [Gemmatimonadaceae bacterium]|nr:hypothetical protein [Gemmatimonadaceae bacterium]
MPKVLALVHGMGVNGDGWARPVVAALNAAARRYEEFRDAPPIFLLARDANDTSVVPSPDQVLCVPCSYDAELRARVESFQRDVTAVLDAPGVTLPGDVRTVLGKLKTAGETEQNAFWTHVVDVLLYRYFALVTKQVRVAVMDSLAALLARPDVELSVMAHSLGTAVAHDALATMARGLVPELGALRPPGVRIANLFMVANVSRILEKALDGDQDVFESPVCPVSVRGDDAYLGAYVNLRHMLDPFPVPRRFEPQWAGRDFVAIDRLLHVSEFDVHGWTHYLANPEVHIPVPRRVAKQLETKPTVAQLILGGVQYYAAVQAARKLCGVLDTAGPLGGIA